jgi:hypothetical protein
MINFGLGGVCSSTTPSVSTVVRVNLFHLYLIQDLPKFVHERSVYTVVAPVSGPINEIEIT